MKSVGQFLMLGSAPGVAAEAEMSNGNANAQLVSSFDDLDLNGYSGGAAPAAAIDFELAPVEKGALLDQLNFSDLYIRVDEREPSRYRIGPNAEGKSGLLEVPKKYEAQVDLVRTQVSNQKRDEGTLSHDSMRLRFQRARVIDDRVYASIRRIPHEIPDLGGLSMNPEAVKIMHNWVRRRGIVLVGGATGAGKTTTSAALIKGWVTHSGGAAVAIEDPPEYRLHGPMGEKGACYQLEVRDDDEWADAIKTALRWRPKIIFLGEIRTVAAARQALRASTSGHLVLTTVHGGSIEETVEALLRLAEADMGETAARLVLADNLVGVIHQKLGRFGPDVDLLEIPARQKRTEGAKQMIRTGKTDGLDNKDYVKQFLAPRDE